MCGISGILDESQPLARETLHKMIRRLEHCGPDSEGVFIEGSIRFSTTPSTFDYRFERGRKSADAGRKRELSHCIQWGSI